MMSQQRSFWLASRTLQQPNKACEQEQIDSDIRGPSLSDSEAVRAAGDAVADMFAVHHFGNMLTSHCWCY